MSSAKCCPLAGWFSPAGTAVQALGLSLLIGGMLALGAFTAPAVFHGLPRNMAAPLMSKIFSRYDLVVLGAMLLTQIGEYFRWISHAFSAKSRLNIVRLVLLGLLTIGVIYSTQTLNPQIADMNMAGIHRDMSTKEGREFDVLHKRAETLYKAELLISLLMLLLTPFVRPAGENSAKTGAAVACNQADATVEPKGDCCP